MPTDRIAGLASVRALIAARKSNKVREADGSTREGISLDSQDSYSREFCERQGWTVVGAPQDTVSGRKAPIDRKELGKWIRDRAHEFDVIVAYKTDRLSRGDTPDWTAIQSWADDKGKTLVMVDGATGIRYPDRDDSDYYQWSSAKRVAGQEWEASRERSMRAQKSIRANGCLVGVAPFGYAVEGLKYGKRLTATATGSKYVPEIFERVSNGASLRDIAAWLHSEHVRPNKRRGARDASVWAPSTIARLVKRTAYRGDKANGAGTLLDCPPLVSPELWQRANDVLSHKPRTGQRGTVKTQKALLASVLACARCGHPMYRILAGNAPLRYAYYRCADYRGSKSCGLMTPLAATDALAVSALSKLTVKLLREETAKVTDYAAEWAVKRQERKNLDDLDRDYYARRHAELSAEIDELAELMSAPAAPRTRMVASSYTYADMAAQPETLGDKLRSDKVRIYASKGPEAVQRLTDAATAALATGGPADVRYALAEADGVWIAVEYRSA